MVLIVPEGIEKAGENIYKTILRVQTNIVNTLIKVFEPFILEVERGEVWVDCSEKRVYKLLSLNENIIRRKCYGCPKEINFVDFCLINSISMSKERLEKIWASPHIRLLCCTCYNKETKSEYIIKKRVRLLAKAERIWFKFGLDL